MSTPTPSKPAVAQATAAGGNKPLQPAAPQKVIAPKAPPFRLEDPQQRGRYHKWLIYGNYGTGKTTLACSAVEVPSWNDVLMVNAEGGDQSVDDLGITTIRVTTYKTLAQVKDYLVAHCKARDADDIPKLTAMEEHLRGTPLNGVLPKKFQTLIVDTVSEVESYCMYQLLGVTDATALDEEVASPEWAEYKKSRHMMLRMVRQLRDLPMNVIFTCAEQFTQDETKKMKYGPALIGKFAKDIQGFMDLVGYYQTAAPLDNGTVPRRLSVLPSGRFDAKHRYKTFKGAHIENPTVQVMLNSLGVRAPEA